MKWSTLVKAAIAIALLALLFWTVDWQESLRLLLEADIAFFGLAFLVNSIGMVISATKWWILLRAHRIAISVYHAIRSYWLGAFASNYLPSTVGGDLVRVASLHVLGRTTAVAASVLVERMTGFAVLLVLCAAALLARPGGYADAGILAVLWLLVIGFAAVLLVVTLCPDVLSRWLSGHFSYRNRLVQQLRERLARFVLAYRHYHDHPREIGHALVMSIGFYVCTVFSQYFCLWSVGHPLPFIEVAFIAPLLPLVGVIPISLNGLGLMEGAFVLFYSAAGVPLEAAFAASLVRRLVTMLVSVVGAVFWLMEGPQRQT